MTGDLATMAWTYFFAQQTSSETLAVLQLFKRVGNIFFFRSLEPEIWFRLLRIKKTRRLLETLKENKRKHQNLGSRCCHGVATKQKTTNVKHFLKNSFLQKQDWAHDRSSSWDIGNTNGKSEEDLFFSLSMDRSSAGRGSYPDLRHLEDLGHQGSGLHLALGAALGGSGPTLPSVPRGAAKRKPAVASAFPVGVLSSLSSGSLPPSHLPQSSSAVSPAPGRTHRNNIFPTSNFC
jgi:hypothetical protein